MGKIIICTVPKSSDAAFNGLGDGIRLPLGCGVTLPLSQSTDCYEMTLIEVEYDKGLFSPASLNLRFSVNEKTYGHPTVASLKKDLIEQEMMVDVFDYDEKYAKGKDGGDPEDDKRRYIAKNHYVHGIDFVRSRTGKTECVLKCFSYDRKITAGRSCSVFSGRMFGQEIYCGELDKTVLKDYYSFSPASLLMMGYNGKNMHRDGCHDEELVHPYLVRYDESLYDFFVRVAHRCGEFLYFDDGKLHLGLPEETVTALVTKTYESLDTDDEHYPLFSYREIGGDADDDSPEFSTNYLTGKLDNSSGGAVRDLQLTSDDYLRLISTDDRIKNTMGWWALNKALTTFFTSSDAVQGGITAVWNFLVDMLSCAIVVPDTAESSFNETYVKNDNAYVTDIKDKTMQNLCNAYYSQIERLEVRSERGMVSIDYSDYLPSLQIGSAFKSTDGIADAYVVTRMYGSFAGGTSDAAVSRSNYVEAVPVIPSTFDDLPAVAVPPRRDISHFRKSGPKEVLVTRNDDPLRLGRVKIRYPWQYDDGNGSAAQSPWIRVAVPFAGSQESSGGFMMTPEVGEHVMVKYLADNMERPYIDGSLYSRSKKPSTSSGMKPYFLTGEKKGFVVSSPNGHSLKINDTGDTNALEQLLPPLKPILSLVELCGGGSYDSYLGEISGGEISLSDGSSMCEMKLSPDKRSISISSNYGSVNISAFTGMSISAPNGDIKIKGKNVTIEACNNLSLNSGANIKSEKTDYASMIGAILGEAAASTLNGTLKAYTGVDLSGCLDLSFIRCLLEIILRPVEGTLSMKSNRNVVMTAGRGKVNVPVTMLSKAKKKDGRKNGWKTYDQFEADSPKRVYDSVEWLMLAIDSFYQAEKNEHELLTKLNTRIRSIFSHYENDSRLKAPFNKISENEHYFLDQAAEEKSTAAEGDVFANTPLTDDVLKQLYAEYKTRYDELKKKVKNYMESYKEMTKLDASFKDIYGGSVKVQVADFPDGYNNKNGNKKIYNLANEKEILKYDHGTNSGAIKKFIAVQKRSALLQALTGYGCKFYLKDATTLASAEDVIEAAGNGTALGTIDKISDNPLKNLIMTGDADFKKKITGSLIPPRPEETKPKDKTTVGGFFKSMLSAAIKPVGGGGVFNSSTQQWEHFPNTKGILNYNGAAGPRSGILSEVSTNGNIMLSSSGAKTLHLKSDASGWFPTVNVADSASLKELINSIKGLDDTAV